MTTSTKGGDTAINNLCNEYGNIRQKNPGKSPGEPPLADQLLRPEHRWEDSLTLNAIETMLDSGLNIFQFHRSGIEPDQAAYLRKELSRIQSELDWLEKKATPEGFHPGSFSLPDLNLLCALEWADFRKPFPWRGGD